MITYIVRRLIYVPFMLFGMSLLLFYLLSSRPGDAAIISVGMQSGSCPECLAKLQKDLGLDRPFLVQYGDWASHAVRGDFGRSLTNQRPIGPELKKRLPNTIEIAVVTVLLTLSLGVPVGVISAVRSGTFIDYGLRSVTILGLSIPSFWMGTLVITLPVLWWGWTPLSPRWAPFVDDPLRNLKIVVWPCLTLAIASSAYVARIIRQSMIETLHSDHVRTARAKGLPGSVVLLRHAFRLSLVTVLTVIGIQFGTVLGGSVVIEQIFNVPGVGNYSYQAVFGRDYRTVMAVTMVFATMFIFVTLAVDLLYAYVDPRIRYS